MTSQELVLRLMDEANPIPDLDVFSRSDVGADAYLTAFEQRSDHMIDLEPENRQETRKSSHIGPRLAAAAALVIVGVVATFIVQNQSNPAAATDPVATIEAYADAYNQHDINGVMAFFSDESVVTGHPSGEPGAAAVGLGEIRRLHVDDLGHAASEDAYTFTNITETSPTSVTWDHEWVNGQGESFCMTGNSAVIEGGIIVSWSWPAATTDCP